MPSVGGLLIPVNAKIDDLEKNLNKAQAKIRELEGTAKRSGAGMATSLNAASKATSALGDNFGRSVGQKLAQGMLLASSAMKVFDKNMDETTRGILDGGAKVAAAWAMGSPMMAAVIAGLEIWAYNQEKVTRQIKETQAQSAKLTAFRLEADSALETMADREATAAQKLNKQLREQEDIVTALKSKLAVDDMFGKTPNSEIGKQTKEMSEHVKVIEGLARQADKLTGPLRSIFSISRDARSGMGTADRGAVENELAKRLQIIEALGRQIQMEQALEAVRMLGIGRGPEIAAAKMAAAGVPSAEIGLLQQIEEYEQKIAIFRGINTEEAKKQVRELTLMRDGTVTLLGLERDRASLKVTEDITNEIELRSAVTDELRRQIELSRELNEWTKKGASPALIEQLKAATIRSQVIQSWRPIFQTIESALTDAIVDGLTNGFKNGADIAKRLVNTLLSQLIGSIVSSGINALMGGIFGGGGGGLGGLGGIATAVIGGVTGGGGGGGGAGGVLSLPDT